MDLVIRPLEGLEEREACVALQQRVWGSDFADRVPASMLMIAGETGGVASGAFLGDRLVGFVFGVTGLVDGQPTHWSDMLAVDPEYRGHGIGFRLKLHQRELLLELGVEHVRWTFDPLEAANAHINLRRLGATAREYRRELYGPSDSPLHAGIGTDRLVAEWAIASERVGQRLSATFAPEASSATGAVLNLPGRGDKPTNPGGVQEPTGPIIRVAIPSNVQALKQADLDEAIAWRQSVRIALETAFRAGYTAVDLERGGRAAYYVLKRGFDL